MIGATTMLILGVLILTTPEQTVVGYAMGIVCLFMFSTGVWIEIDKRRSP